MMKTFLTLMLLFGSLSSFGIDRSKIRNETFFDKYDRLDFTVHKIKLPHAIKGFSILYSEEREYDFYVRLDLCLYDGVINERNLVCEEITRTRNFHIKSNNYPTYVSSTAKSKFSVTSDELKEISDSLEEYYPGESQMLRLHLVRYEDRMIRRDLHEDKGLDYIYLTTLALDKTRYTSYGETPIIEHTFKTEQYYVHTSEHIYAEIDVMGFPKI